MEYSDEWWKAAGSPYFHGIGGYPTDTQPDGYANEEWWGVMAIQDNGSSPDIMIPRQVYYALASEFEEPNEPPVLDPIGDRIVNETETLIIDVDASDPDNDTLLYGTSAIFGTFDPVTGLFTWTPTYDDSGVYYVTFNVTDGLEWDNETITITVNNVNRPPVLDTIDDRIVYENETLIIQLNATDPDNDTLVYGTNATFGSFNPNIGLFEWTPTFDDSDVYSVLFNVTDGQLWDSEIIYITVINVNRVPVLESIGNKEVDEGQLLQFTVSATDPDNDNLTYSANNLPTGASFNPDAQEFIWTPTYDQTGVYSDVQFVVSDGDLTDYENITITVNNVNRAPILNPIGDRIIDEGETLVIDVNAIDPDDDTLTYYTNATFGTFNTTTGLFEWVPDFDDAGVYSVMFNVTDGEFWDEETIAITVNNAGLIDLWMTNFTGPLIHPGAIPLAFATVKNIGPDDSGPFEVGFYKLRGRIRYNRTDWWNWDISFISSEEVTNLTPNESIEVPFGGYCRTCTILAIADHTQIINETNEYNNVKRYPELTPYVIRPY